MLIEPFNQTIEIFKEDDLVCYCFEFTRDQIEKDYADNGYSTILEKIEREKKSGGCDCAQKNPKGRWCLSDVRRVVDNLANKK